MSNQEFRKKRFYALIEQQKRGILYKYNKEMDKKKKIKAWVKRSIKTKKKKKTNQF